MYRIFLLFILLIASMACGGGGNKPANSGNIQKTFTVDTKLVQENNLAGRWYGVSTIVDEMPRQPSQVRESNFVITDTGSWGITIKHTLSMDQNIYWLKASSDGRTDVNTKVLDFQLSYSANVIQTYAWFVIPEYPDHTYVFKNTFIRPGNGEDVRGLWNMDTSKSVSIAGGYSKNLAYTYAYYTAMFYATNQVLQHDKLIAYGGGIEDYLYEATYRDGWIIEKVVKDAEPNGWDSVGTYTISGNTLNLTIFRWNGEIQKQVFNRINPEQTANQ